MYRTKGVSLNLEKNSTNIQKSGTEKPENYRPTSILRSLNNFFGKLIQKQMCKIGEQMEHQKQTVWMPLFRYS